MIATNPSQRKLRTPPDFDWPADLDVFARRHILARAHQVIRHPGFTESDLADVLQELVFLAWRSLAQFNSKRGAWTTFVSRVVDAGVVSILRRSKAAKRGSGSLAHLGDGVAVGDDQRVQRASADVHAIDRRLDVTDAVAGLADELRPAAEELQSVSQTAAARALKKSRRALRRDIARIRALFADASLDDYA